MERQQVLGGPNQHGKRLLRRYSKLTHVNKPRQADSVEVAPETRSSDFESEKIEDTRDVESQQDVSGQKEEEAARRLRTKQNLQEIIANTLSTELLHDQVSKDRIYFQNELATKYANMDLECRNLIQRVQHDISCQNQQKMKERLKDQLRQRMSKDTENKESNQPAFRTGGQGKSRRRIEEQMHLDLWRNDRKSFETVTKFGTKYHEQILEQKCRAWC